MYANLSLLVLFGWSVALANPALAQSSFDSSRSQPEASSARPLRPTTGIVDDDLWLRGRFAGRIDQGRINCLGHAAGIGVSVQTGELPLGDALSALGYACKVAEPESLLEPIAAGRSVMMVYLYVYPDEHRPAADRGSSAAEMAARYGWGKEPWRQKELFFHLTEERPFDFHAIGYDPVNASWSWVTHARDKEPDGSYRVDSTPEHPASVDPDRYFPPELVVTKLACEARR